MLSLVWKQHEYVRLARALDLGEKARMQLQSGVMLLETEVRSLRQPARLEALARGRFRLVDPGPPIAVRPEGFSESPAGGVPGENLHTANWRGGLAWRTKGW